MFDRIFMVTLATWATVITGLTFGIFLVIGLETYSARTSLFIPVLISIIRGYYLKKLSEFLNKKNR